MGKKSKRKSNNKLPPCYHGITKKEFNFGGHHKILESYDEQNNTQEGRNEFFEKHQHIVSNPTFGRFVIAHITDDYLKGKDNAILLHRLLLFLNIRYDLIPRREGKDVDSPESEYYKNYCKYDRDIDTERGRIKCMEREIPCDCMEEKRIAAKLMDKVNICFGCGNEFLKEELLRCERCDYAQYCSKKCSKKDWPRHKEYCSPASIPTPASPPSFGKPSDVDVDVDVDVDINIDAEEE